MFNRLVFNRFNNRLFGKFLYVSVFFLTFTCFQFFAVNDIFCAIDKGDFKLVKKLLSAGDVSFVNIYVENNSFADGETLLNAACYKGNLDIIKLVASYYYKNLCDHYDKKFYDDEYGEVKSAQGQEGKGMFLNRINFAGVDGQTPLHCACYPSGKVDHEKTLSIVNYLFLIGGLESINKLNAYGRSPVDLAFQDRNFELVKFLVSKGAKVNAKYIKSIMVGASDADLLFDNLKTALELAKKYSCENYKKRAKEFESRLDKDRVRFLGRVPGGGNSVNSNKK